LLCTGLRAVDDVIIENLVVGWESRPRDCTGGISDSRSSAAGHVAGNFPAEWEDAGVVARPKATSGVLGEEVMDGGIEESSCVGYERLFGMELQQLVVIERVVVVVVVLISEM
jgi:hypothetical protein